MITVEYHVLIGSDDMKFMLAKRVCLLSLTDWFKKNDDIVDAFRFSYKLQVQDCEREVRDVRKNCIFLSHFLLCFVVFCESRRSRLKIQCLAVSAGLLFGNIQTVKIAIERKEKKYLFFCETSRGGYPSFTETFICKSEEN